MIEMNNINRSVSRGNNNNAQRITLPLEWSKLQGYPSNVRIMVGVDVLIIAADEDIVIEAASSLVAAGLFTPLEKNMEIVG